MSNLRPRSSFSVVKGYNPTVDYGRMLAAFLIVEFHAASPLAFLGQAAVGFFVIAMIWFTMLGLARPKVGFDAFAKTRAIKLLYPFAVWSVLQCLAKILSGDLTPAQMHIEVMEFLPPSGSFNHLWFLPWALVITLLLGFVFWKKAPTQTSNRSFALSMIAAGAVIVGCLSLWSFASLPLILGLCLLYTPSVATGLLIYTCRDRIDRLFMITVGAVLGGLLMQYFGVLGTIQLYVSVPFTVLALLIKLPEFSWTRRLGTLAMDLYLCHILVLGVGQNLLNIDTTTLIGGLGIGVLAVLVAMVMQIPAIGKWLR